MMYHTHEMTRLFFGPLGKLSKIQSSLLKNRINPYSYLPGSKSFAAMGDVFYDLTRRYKKPEFDLTSTVCNGETIEVSESVVLRKPFGQLKHFERAISRPDDPKVLIVVPMSGHFATLLRDTVKTLLPDHDVYITEWRDASKVPITKGNFGLDEYIDYVIEFLEHLGPESHVLAICQPVVPALAAVSLMAEDNNPATPKTMTLMGGPADARIDPTEPGKLALKNKLSWFRNNVIYRVPANNIGAMRKVYPGFLQLTAFISMNPDRHSDSYRNYFKALRDGDDKIIQRHRKFYDEYLAVMDMPDAFYLDTIQKVFQEFHLAKGCFHHRGRLVKPEAIKQTALMTVEGDLDDICSPGQTAAAHTLCSGIPDHKRREHLQKGAGHYGIFSGSLWREEVAPAFKDFIRNT